MKRSPLLVQIGTRTTPDSLLLDSCGIITALNESAAARHVDLVKRGACLGIIFIYTLRHFDNNAAFGPVLIQINT